MSLWNKIEIKSALNLTTIQDIKSNINEVSIDSRKKTDHGLFIAIRGKYNDGHKFLEQAFNNGAIVAIVEEIPPFFEKDLTLFSKLIVVQDSFEALNQLAAYARDRFYGKIIAITGSVGKTCIKEILRTVFTSQGKTFASMGNFNNHFGLPLSLCNLSKKYDYGIFEMGMNHLGEIASLTKIAKPHIAIISNITAAHIGNFNNEQEIALAKSEIFSGVVKDGFAVINNDNKYHDYLELQAITNGIDQDNIINFGYKNNSNIRLNSIKDINQSKSQATININLENKKLKDDISKSTINYFINSINETTIYNSLIAIAALKIIGNNLTAGLKSLANLETLTGRGNLIKINKNGLNITIIDDSYNANLASMIAGLKFLSDLKNKHQKTKARTIAIIGDMLELGKRAIDQHKAIAEYIIKYDIDQIFLVGELMQNLIPELKKEKIVGYFKTPIQVTEKLPSFLQNGDILLIKGSRGMAMERIVKQLCQR